MPSPEDYAHAWRINSQLNYIYEELQMLDEMQRQLDRLRQTALTKQASLVAELDYLKATPNS